MNAIKNGNYFLTKEQNRLIIDLPQTVETLTSTTSPIEDRRIELTSSEYAIILEIVKRMYTKDLTEGVMND